MERRNVLIGAGGAAVAVGGMAVAWRLAAGSPSAYAQYADGLRAPLPERAEIEHLIRHATLAANSHNTQPWRFIASADAIDILPDLTRATPAVDPDNHHLFISLGCAMENLVVAATASGRPGTVTVKEDGSQRYTFSRGTPRPDALLQAITQRQSTRAAYDGRPVEAQDTGALQRAASAPGVHAVILTERAQMDRVRDLVVAGNDAQLADPAFMAELKAWLRVSATARDGFRRWALRAGQWQPRHAGRSGRTCLRSGFHPFGRAREVRAPDRLFGGHRRVDR